MFLGTARDNQGAETLSRRVAASQNASLPSRNTLIHRADSLCSMQCGVRIVAAAVRARTIVLNRYHRRFFFD
jgi:hypothetical protein